MTKRVRARVWARYIIGESIGEVSRGQLGGAVGVSLKTRYRQIKINILACGRTHGTPPSPRYLLAIPTYFLYFEGFLYGIPDEHVRGDAPRTRCGGVWGFPRQVYCHDRVKNTSCQLKNDPSCIFFYYFRITC